MQTCLRGVENIENIVGEYCGRRKMYGRLYEPAFAHKILCKNCHWTSVTSMDRGNPRKMVRGKKIPRKMVPGEKWSFGTKVPGKKIPGQKISSKMVPGKMVPGKMVFKNFYSTHKNVIFASKYRQVLLIQNGFVVEFWVFIDYVTLT